MRSVEQLRPCSIVFVHLVSRSKRPLVFLALALLIGPSLGCVGIKEEDLVDSRFVSFTAGPQTICLNYEGPAFVQVDFEVELGTIDQSPENTCVDVKANGEPVHFQMHVQCMDDGLSGGTTFDLKTSGANYGSTVTIRGEVVPRIAGEPHDEQEVVLDVKQDCPPPTTVPG